MSTTNHEPKSLDGPYTNIQNATQYGSKFSEAFKKKGSLSGGYGGEQNYNSVKRNSN